MMKRLNLKKNKKGDIASLIYVVIVIFCIGFVVILANKLNHKIFDAEETIFNNSVELNNSAAIPAIQKIRNVDDTAWDYAFLGIYVAVMLGLGMTAYAQRINIAFFWVYIIMSLVVLMLGVAMSNAWQTAVESDALSDVVVRFPITNFLLGTYAPLVVTALIMVTALLLFAKPPETAGGVISG